MNQEKILELIKHQSNIEGNYSRPEHIEGLAMTVSYSGSSGEEGEVTKSVLKIPKLYPINIDNPLKKDDN